MASSTHGLKSTLLGLGNEKLQELMGELMKNEHFQQALGNAMTRAFSAKNQLEKNMEFLLGVLSVPSRADVRRVEDKLETLVSKVAALTARMDSLAQAQVKTAPAASAPAAKPAARAKGGAAKRKTAG